MDGAVGRNRSERGRQRAGSRGATAGLRRKLEQILPDLDGIAIGELVLGGSFAVDADAVLAALILDPPAGRRAGQPAMRPRDLAARQQDRLARQLADLNRARSPQDQLLALVHGPLGDDQPGVEVVTARLEMRRNQVNGGMAEWAFSGAANGGLGDLYRLAALTMDVEHAGFPLANPTWNCSE